MRRDEDWPPGWPSWIDLAVDDVDAAARFYAAVLGWEVVARSRLIPDYRYALVDGRMVAGLSPHLGVSQPDGWTLYFATRDSDTVAAAITESGGQIYRGPVDVKDRGRFTMAADPAGCPVGLWQGMGLVGMELARAPGALVWAEARPTDVDRVVPFYRAVLGRTLTDRLDPDDPGADPGADDGVAITVARAAAPPSRWLPHFGVVDPDRAAERVVAGGGRVVGGPRPTALGRAVEVEDPTGVAFGIIGVDPPVPDGPG